MNLSPVLSAAEAASSSSPLNATIPVAVRAVEADADASTANAAVYFVVASNDAEAHLIAF